MGSWGLKPYENDFAADWFSHHIAEALADSVREELALPLEKDTFLNLYTAAFLVERLALPYLWPGGEGDRLQTLDKAIQICRTLSTHEDWSYFVRSNGYSDPLIDLIVGLEGNRRLRSLGGKVEVMRRKA